MLLPAHFAEDSSPTFEAAEPQRAYGTGFDTELMGSLGGEMVFMQELAHAGKIAQGLFVARKKG